MNSDVSYEALGEVPEVGTLLCIKTTNGFRISCVMLEARPCDRMGMMGDFIVLMPSGRKHYVRPDRCFRHEHKR